MKSTIEGRQAKNSIRGAFAAAAVAALGMLSAPVSADAAGFFQNYQVEASSEAYAIALYQTTSNGSGITNSFTTSPPSTLMTDPFLKLAPITATYFLGVSTLGSESEEPTEHLVLALDDVFAAGLIGGGLDFTEIFTDYDEGSLIGALVLLTTQDLAEDDPGRAAQIAAKDDAYNLLFQFSDTVVTQGGAFGSTDTFTMVSFSSASAFGGGNSFTTAGPTTVPEPAAWSLMILGFGSTGAMIRRRRSRDTFAAA